MEDFGYKYIHKLAQFRKLSQLWLLKNCAIDLKPKDI